MPSKKRTPSHAEPVTPDLPLPHERDQATGGEGTQRGAPQGSAAHERQHTVIERARRDLESGQVDTDLHGTPGLDDARRRELLRRGS